MGRTIPSYRMILEREIQKWEAFLKALRKEDRDAFEELMNACRRLRLSRWSRHQTCHNRSHVHVHPSQPPKKPEGVQSRP